MRVQGVDRETARRRMQETDGARDAYVRQLYRTEPYDPKLYHLVVDSTAIDLDACVELIAIAAEARGGVAATL
jgi:cytidylate kinase